MRRPNCAHTPQTQARTACKPPPDHPHLLALNHACAEKEKAGEKITPPGLPLPPAEHAAFITEDCIEAPAM